MDTPIVAYGYIRVSGIAQTNGHGPDRQRELIEQYATGGGIAVVGWFEDVWTGAEEERPGFVRALAAMMGNGVRTIVVESLDRFARDLLVQTALLAKLAAHDLTLISASTGEDVTASMRADPMRRALVQIQGVFAELDKNLLVRRLRNGKDALRASGLRAEGPPAFGECEGEAAVLARIRQLRRKPRMGERLSYGEVAAALNAEGVPTRKGGAWKRGTVGKFCKRMGC